MRTTTQETPEQTGEFIIGLYKQYGDEDYIGEPVSQVEHMCQCALLAEQEGYGEEIILAAFFHDIGHLCEHIMPTQQMNDFGVVDHEKLGAEYLLSKGFSNVIANLVENHVQAKRYLLYKFPDYYDQLSEASKQTLEFQGGRMTAGEASIFEEEPLFELYIKLRKWDERAKLKDQPLPSLDKYREMIIRQLNK